jgi:KamA family protein
MQEAARIRPIAFEETLVDHRTPIAQRSIRIPFLEGPRVLDADDAITSEVTRYQVTKYYRDLVATSPYRDQLKYIVEPSLQELSSPGMLDTSGEQDNTVVTGLQHKYPTTGLLLVTDRCTSYCRYCFRKRIVGKDSDEVTPDYEAVAAYIRRHPEMTNVLMSGGDPFVLSTGKLHAILDHLLPIPHLTSLRFGSKTTAFRPARFHDPELRGLFERVHDAGKTPVIVSHFDHVGEITDEAAEAIARVRGYGVTYLNQSVLLGRVNDDPGTLTATIARLHAVGTRPYYVFQGRPVKGASHFQVPIRRGLEIVRATNERLSGIQKTFRYIMSHYTGKIEILDLSDDNRLYLRYHQSPRPGRIGRIFSRPYVEGACWLDDLPQDQDEPAGAAPVGALTQPTG